MCAGISLVVKVCDAVVPEIVTDDVPVVPLTVFEELKAFVKEFVPPVDAVPLTTLNALLLCVVNLVNPVGADVY